ncbi:PaaI family thioesterase [Helicobacter sp. 23-1045]
MSESEILDEISTLKVCKKLATHLCGEIVEMTPNSAVVKFSPSKDMICDENMLIHNGFLFNAASFCAMAAVNEANSVIIYSSTKFLSPFEFGNEITFKAKSAQSDLKKREVAVEGFLYNLKIFEAEFHIAVFEKGLFKIDFSKVK